MTRAIVVGRQRPHEVLLLAWSLVFGVAGLMTAPAPSSIAALVPHWEILVWSALLAASGATGLIGVSLRRNWFLGLQVEAGAQLIGTGALLVYAAAVAVVAGWRGLFAGGFIVTWMIANLVRVWQISRDLKGI
jgi:hypothetical protein